MNRETQLYLLASLSNCTYYLIRDYRVVRKISTTYSFLDLLAYEPQAGDGSSVKYLRTRIHGYVKTTSAMTMCLIRYPLPPAPETDL